MLLHQECLVLVPSIRRNMGRLREVRRQIANLKLMVEQIGASLHYPGIINTGIFPDGLWHSIKRSFGSLRSHLSSLVVHNTACKQIAAVLVDIDQFMRNAQQFMVKQHGQKNKKIAVNYVDIVH